MEGAAARRLEERIIQWLRPQATGLQPAVGDFAVGTQLGLARKENQDRVLYVRLPGPTPWSGPATLAVLCDGMGGMVDGARCAELAIGAFVATIVSGRWKQSFELLVEQAVRAADLRVYSNYRGKGGTTIAAALCYQDSLFLCHVGDSRIYSATQQGALRQVGADDTMQAQLAAIGQLPASLEPDHLRLVQFVGMGPAMQPHFLHLEAAVGQRLLLASDGVYRPILPLLDGLTQNAPTPRKLLERLLNLSVWLGGHDNASAIALTVPRAAAGTLFKDDERDPDLIEFWGPTETLNMMLLPADSGGRQLSLEPRPQTGSPAAQPPPRVAVRRSKKRRKYGGPPAQPAAKAPVGNLSMEVGAKPASPTVAKGDDQSPPKDGATQNRQESTASNPGEGGPEHRKSGE